MHTAYCLFPKSLDQGLDWTFCMQHHHSFPPALVTTLSEGRVLGLDGKVILHDGRLLGDASKGYNASFESLDFFPNLNLPDEEYIDGTVAVLAAPYSNCYYHWMFDVLPRLHLLRQSGITCDKYLVNWDGLSFQTETLTMLGVPENKLIKSKPDLYLKAQRLVIPSLSTHAGYVPEWVCSSLRSELLCGMVSEPIEEFRKIYISRDDAIHRHVVNEKELITFLSDFGFSAVLPGSLSLAEQISIFSSAQVVIAPHGAGLTNLLFCNPGTKVIEFFSPNYVRHHYWWLANHLGLDYYYFEGLGDRPPRGISHFARTDNIEVSLDPANLIELYRKFIRIAEPIPKNNAATTTDWQHIALIEGCLSQPVAVALQWLVRQLPIRALVVELGTSSRRASVVIASALPPAGHFYYINELGDANCDVLNLCDMVFVNTKSDYQSVRQAILRWYPMLKIGGYMVFHNYGWLTGVKKAVLSFGLNGHFIAESLWCHRKADELLRR
ncbi:hypothetical protein SDC9_11413 [bioreactor metagenome]|uniref:Glycosyltransferase 61 catalytic domain-containing protein n=1 Tax=bioreactor metagenome TaxID=1076179 RepID=A0A644TGB9_9ZZZZ|nr:glycosyltransferase 61 family protein [Negativicutes bacterium]